MAQHHLAVPPHVAAAPAGVIGDIEAFGAALDAGAFAAAWDNLHTDALAHLDATVQEACRFYGNHQPPDARDEDLQWP